MRWVIKRTNEPAEVFLFKGNTLQHAQKAVGGYVESIHVTEEVDILVNEDGFFLGLPENCGFLGTFLFVGVSGDSWQWCSLDDEQVRKSLAWCDEHANDRHSGEEGFRVLAGERAQAVLTEAGKTYLHRMAEWERL
ncbi:MAG: DUF3846 domain-containing protein [Patescibacteria group bacterium]|nr:DUF3846 domain-containing protein [Patescibacteria group bacterium]